MDNSNVVAAAARQAFASRVANVTAQVSPPAGGGQLPPSSHSLRSLLAALVHSKVASATNRSLVHDGWAQA
jgi:hypothetical protein